VVFVGPGSPAHADTFARTLPAAVTVLCDPGLGVCATDREQRPIPDSE
jgi:hypothetical protein